MSIGSGKHATFFVWAVTPILLAIDVDWVRGAPIRFLVAEIPGHVSHNDSYVLPLSDPAAIAHARELIVKGPSAGAPIAVAAIAKGANGINRNVRATSSPPWSWH